MSDTDHPRIRGSHKAGHAQRMNFMREGLFVRYNVFGPTYRSAHQAPVLEETDLPTGVRMRKPSRI